MSYTFRRAVREQCFTLTGFAGPSGSGKTFSALRFAVGLANGGKIAMIDTEARRGLHYADQFDYLYSELTAPFTPERYIEAIQSAEKAGAAVIIVDSMSHEHEGPGGILEMHEAELGRMAGDDWRKREQCKFAAWIKPKAAHNRFVNTVLQVKAHLIFCFRAKEKLKLVKNEKGKLEPMPQGWQPICSDRFEYEMTALLMLPPNSRGKPDFQEGATKLQEQHRAIFDAGRSIDENMGKALATWAAGGAESTPVPPAGNGHDKLPLDMAREAAAQGTEAFRAFWNSPEGKKHRAGLKPHLDEFKATAAEADRTAEEDDDDPFADETPSAPAPPSEDAEQGGGGDAGTDGGPSPDGDAAAPEPTNGQEPAELTDEQREAWNYLSKRINLARTEQNLSMWSQKQETKDEVAKLPGDWQSKYTGLLLDRLKALSEKVTP